MSKTTTRPIEATRRLLFPNGESMLVIQATDTGEDATEKQVSSVEEAVAFLDGQPGNFLLQTFTPDGEPVAYIGLAAVLKADHYIPPTITLKREGDGLRFGIWRLATPIAVADKKQVEMLEDIARGLGNEKAADAAPMPGTDGWTIVEMEAERAYSLDHMKRAHVHLYGPFDREFVARTLELSTSRRSKKTLPGKWHAATMTVEQFIYSMGKHDAGVKDGESILQGVALAGNRVKAAMERLYVLGLDLDTGESLASLRQKIRAEGWFALVWSTHSHLTTISDPLRDQVMRHAGRAEGDPTIEEGVRYLRDVKRTQEWVLDGAELRGFEHTTDGVKMLISHKELPKYRILFVLKEAFQPARRGGTHAAGMTEWSERYAGVSERIGATWDRSCVDVCRLFFTGRHPHDAKEWHVEVIGGAPLDLEKIDRVKAGRSAQDPYSAAGDDMGGGGGKQFKTRGLVSFWTKHKHTFDMRTFFEDRFIGDQRDSRHFRCPNDGNHNDPGNPEDRGFAVWNPDESDSQQAVGYCQHDTCKALCAGPSGLHDSLPLLDLACQEVGIEDASELLEWVPETVEGDDQKEETAETKHEEKPTRPRSKQSKQAEKSDPDNDALFQEFSKEWAYVAEGPSGRFVKALPDGTLEFKGVEALDKLYAHKPVIFLDQNGKPKLRPLVKEWIKWHGSENRKYSGIRFAPGKSDGEIKPYLNTWRGLGVVPKPGTWARMRKHVEEVLANGNEKDARFLIGWMAHVLQHLGDTRKKLTVSPVIRGIEGAGKSIVFDYYRRIFGRHGLGLSKPEQIVGRFNASLAEALVVQLEEAFFAGDPKIDGPLKDLLTGKEMQIERKNIDPITAPNFAHFVVISNAERPVPINEGSRRYYAIECSDAKANQEAWFDPIVDEMENGGVEAMAWDLLHWSPPDGDWSFLRKLPRTEAGDRMIAAGLSPLERFILTWAWDGAGVTIGAPDLHDDHPVDISTAELVVAFDQWADGNIRLPHERRELRTDAATIGLSIKRMLPLVERAHGRTGNARGFPTRGRVLEMLRMHPNGGYRAFLDRLKQADE